MKTFGRLSYIIMVLCMLLIYLVDSMIPVYLFYVSALCVLSYIIYKKRKGIL